MKFLSLLLSRMRYAWRILWGGYLLAVTACAVLLFAGCLVLPKLVPDPSFYLVKLVIIFTFPLLTIALCAALFADDFSEGTFAHHLSYPYSHLLVFTERIVVVTLLLISYLTAFLWVLDRFVFALDRPHLLYLIKHSFSVNLFVGSLVALCSLLGRNMAVGLGAGATVWLVEYLMAGISLNRYYLFQAVWRASRFADPSANALALVVASGLLLLGCLLTLGKGRGWLVRRQ